MGKFADTIAILRKDVSELTSSDNVDKVAGISKNLDELEAEYNKSEEATKEAKENLVKYVKTYAFKEPVITDTGVETPLTLEEAFEKATKEMLEKRKEK